MVMRVTLGDTYSPTIFLTSTALAHCCAARLVVNARRDVLRPSGVRYWTR